MQFANLAGFENELRAQFCIDFWLCSLLSILHFAYSDLQSTLPALPNFHFGPWAVPFWNLFGFRGAIKICGGLLLELSGLAPVIPRLNNVRWSRIKDRYSDECGKPCRPKLGK